MKQIIAVSLFIIICIVIFYYFKTSGNQLNKPQQNIIVKIGYQPINANLPFFVALDKGYFIEEGVIVKPIRFEASNPIIDGLYTDKLDGGSSVATAALIPAAIKNPGKVKAYMANEATPEKYYYTLTVRTGSKINSLSGLKNKKIGIYPGSAPVTFAKIILKKYLNIDKDIEFIQLAPELEVHSLSTGSVDALFTLEPFGTIAEVTGAGTILIKGPVEKYIVNPYYGGLFVFSTSFINSHPEEAKKIERAMYKAVDYIKTHEREARLVLPKYTPMTKDVALKASFSNFKIVNDIQRVKLQELADILFENKVIDMKIDMKTLLISNKK